MAYRETGARFSIDRRYRYALWQVWGHDKNLYNFLLLNPSSADEATNDLTIERCERRARHGLVPRSAATRARISSKVAAPAGSQGNRRIGAASACIFR
jgi:hypothetical protein